MNEETNKGLLGVVVDETTISQVMPDINSLTYRGYAVQDLCEKCSFEEVAYLILNKELPNKSQLNKFIKQLEKNRNITRNLREISKHMPRKSAPKEDARTAVSVLGLEDKGASNNTPTANMREAIRIVKKTPTAIAAFFWAIKEKNVIPPKKKLSFSENCFYMCFGKVPRKEIIKAFDVSLILYAEHSFNVSTFTVSTITSSLSDIHGAIIGAIASSKGPLHGGANEEVMQMLKKIKKPENAEKWILDTLEKKKLIMGFGHRVYSKGDSRVPTMKKYYLKVAELLKEKNLPKMSQIIEDIMLKKKNIHPNVDYDTGPTYHMMGFDTDFFTPIFVISRITGWSAHIMEQHAANKLIRPLSKYGGEKHRKVTLLNQR